MDKTTKRELLWSLLGDLPDRNRPVSCRAVDSCTRNGYRLETLVLDLNGFEDVPAYFVKPLNAAGPLPAVLYNHAHGGDYVLGKDELLRGRDALYTPPYAELLTGLGYAALCIDTWAFGERRGRRESEIFKHMLWNGQVLWGMMVYDSVKAVDYLAARPDVDESRIGTLGLSMGSTMAWWTAALDERIKVCVDLCCLTDYQALIDIDNLDGHGLYYYVPGLLKHFSAAGVNALIAPRAHLSIAGLYDRLTPPAGLDRIDQALTEAYRAQNAPDAWTLSRYNTGHMETADMRAEVTAYLRRWL
jgi:dienelactone hydrolase